MGDIFRMKMQIQTEYSQTALLYCKSPSAVGARAGNLVSICLMSSEIWVSYSGTVVGGLRKGTGGGRSGKIPFDQVTVTFPCMPPTPLYRKW